MNGGMHQEINNAKIFVSLENTDLPNKPKKKKGLKKKGLKCTESKD